MRPTRSSPGRPRASPARSRVRRRLPVGRLEDVGHPGDDGQMVIDEGPPTDELPSKRYLPEALMQSVSGNVRPKGFRANRSRSRHRRFPHRPFKAPADRPGTRPRSVAHSATSYTAPLLVELLGKCRPRMSRDWQVTRDRSQPEPSRVPETETFDEDIAAWLDEHQAEKAGGAKTNRQRDPHV